MEDNITKDLAKFSLANTIYTALVKAHACEQSALSLSTTGGQVMSESTPFYSPPFKKLLLLSTTIMTHYGNPWTMGVTLSVENQTLKELAVSELKTEDVKGAGKSLELWTLFFQLWTLLKLLLHAVFVFDGLEHLPDKGHKCMLELFGFHWTEVLSEAEAELATMNVHGMIDAVMTEDSDILIFGALCIIRSAKNNKDYLNVQETGCLLPYSQVVVLHSKIGQMVLDAFLLLILDEFSEQTKELVDDLHTLLSTDPYNFLEHRYKAVADRIPHGFPQCVVVSKYVHALMSFLATGNDLASLIDFCCQHLGWEDDAIIEKMYGGVWEGAYLCALCKLLQHSADQANLQLKFKVISQLMLMALRH
ncbi:uncharacterized protein BJ212DRAFT_1479093 [Suillus subaureus]|uniref:XPG-I domain-containing protein n=1 Tax=Suillus subaureus TaxID=48587 RepID=A0A9P7EEX6_9AGAM|nr:uncharacterized protein BJ212DRAFT_1479093 [Suillus subaureus]KAG1818968.1 hypothetical protein BJ212DRAFT_1479093 [Suillus subaureus]